MNQAHLQYERGCTVQESRSSHFATGGGGGGGEGSLLKNLKILPNE